MAMTVITAVKGIAMISRRMATHATKSMSSTIATMSHTVTTVTSFATTDTTGEKAKLPSQESNTRKVGGRQNILLQMTSILTMMTRTILLFSSGMKVTLRSQTRCNKSQGVFQGTPPTTWSRVMRGQRFTTSKTWRKTKTKGRLHTNCRILRKLKRRLMTTGPSDADAGGDIMRMTASLEAAEEAVGLILTEAVEEAAGKTAGVVSLEKNR
mmetsp:Transcript_7014/g.12462  ORF Transcript_7014/g.12462 Transcript_7014/m.12462 type:complete len:211 (-) Transcript_7014:1091-1723(-)